MLNFLLALFNLSGDTDLLQILTGVVDVAVISSFLGASRLVILLLRLLRRLLNLVLQLEGVVRARLNTLELLDDGWSQFRFNEGEVRFAAVIRRCAPRLAILLR